jgi:hypothetical protein
MDPAFIVYSVFRSFQPRTTGCGPLTHLKVFFDTFESPSMNRAISKFADCRFVGQGRVSFVLGKTELRIVFVIPLHQPVTESEMARQLAGIRAGVANYWWP